MRYLIIFLLCSCSVQHHIQRADIQTKKAIKKGAVFSKDTLSKIDTLTTIEFRNDTVFSTSYINTHTTTQGEIRYITRQDKRNELKLQKQVNRLEAKNKRLTERLNARNERVITRHKTKVERINNRSLWWLWLLIGIILGFLSKKLFK